MPSADYSAGVDLVFVALYQGMTLQLAEKRGLDWDLNFPRG
jgi:hypothetical protein